MNDFVYGLHNNSISVEGEKKSKKNITIEETVEYWRVVKISFGFNARRGVTNIFTNVSLNLFLTQK